VLADTDVLVLSGTGDMKILHWMQIAFGLFGLASVMIAAPVSLGLAWINWLRADRLVDGRNWRETMLLAGLITLTLGAILYALLIPLEWWTRFSVSQSQKSLLNAIAMSGATCCILAALASAIAKGRARVSILIGAFFGLFMFAATTPLAYLP
jgi:hypothetical protein